MSASLKPLTHIAAAAALLCTAQAFAQASLPAVTVSGRNADAPVLVGGFGDTPVAKLPLQASVIGAERLADTGIANLAGFSQLDASISDAYNSVGYVSYLKIRGFDLDNRFNYRRDGLPINAETALALGNKSAIEVLKGTSGIQAGTSSPGGQVNLIVKRPTVELLSVSLGVSERGTTEAALDWSQRFGEGKAFGLRVNASAAQLHPELHDAHGSRHLLALAGDWRLSPATLLEAEVELNRQSQPSQPGLSLLGSKLPDASDFNPRLNLNNMPWTLPVVFDNTQGSVRLQHKLSADWQAQAHLGVQRLRTDDRLAYAYGCSAENNYDRYCSDGTFDRSDFRSEGERRNSEALDLSLAGKLMAAGLNHTISTGVLFTHYQGRFNKQAYNLSGVGSVYSTVITPAVPTLGDENTNRDEHSTELYLRDAVQLSADWQAFAGLRHTRIARDSVRTNGSRPTSYTQTLNTPWLGLSYAIDKQLMAYGSWGEGMESEVAPNRKRYSNAGQALPALKSKQIELGLKAGSSTVDWSLNWFSVERPAWRDIGACDNDDVPGSCVRQIDGVARHRGIEAQADIKWAGGGLLASAMQLQARRSGSADASLNGLKPANVAERSLKLTARQNISALPGLQLSAGLAYEGPRAVLPDNSVSIAGWTRIDLGARYEQALGQRQSLIWRAGIDNLADHRAWREAPFQYGHAYLYPLAPRTFRASVDWVL
ncbi:TonB-dependent receptor [Paucibacter sp. APW11]|uniref:TonB-dependent receptor n=1 Tax=Roseateles aquae TaxID=3077235 RepID=A0ABU3PDQ6_9BURK|nr:TonB-dependent receptor [Paucibacter sp. APW11]MDT9000455.1 TonB-dependent receptor [Paucibacter sp. APW11]